MSDLVLKKLGFDTQGCLRSMKYTMNAYMDQLSDKLVEIFMRQIRINGNGSDTMKSDAVRAVREVSREVTDSFIESRVGFDESYAAGLSKDFYVRTMVVIYGNQNGGPIHSKPGQATWRKHVMNRDKSNARTTYDIPQFDQQDVAVYLVDSSMREIEKYFTDMLDALDKTFSGAFFEQFVTVG